MVGAVSAGAVFKFTGKLNKLTLTVNRPKQTPEDEKKLMQAQRNNPASE